MNVDTFTAIDAAWEALGNADNALMGVEHRYTARTHRAIIADKKELLKRRAVLQDESLERVRRRREGG